MRKIKITDKKKEEVQRWHRSGLNLREIAARLKISQSSAWNLVNKTKGEDNYNEDDLKRKVVKYKNALQEILAVVPVVDDNVRRIAEEAIKSDMI